MKRLTERVGGGYSMKPILFNTEMVRAILEDRKTVTRRVVKPQPRNDVEYNGDYYFEKVSSFMGWFASQIAQPYRPGDILYVRETWTVWNGNYEYKADVDSGYGPFCSNCTIDICTGGCNSIIKWRPSIHMPREAARIFLRVTNVRVERLQECGKGWCIDIEREEIVTPQDPILYINDDEFHGALRKEFQKL